MTPHHLHALAATLRQFAADFWWGFTHYQERLRGKW